MKKRVFILLLMFILIGGVLWYFNQPKDIATGDVKLTPDVLPKLEFKYLKIVNKSSNTRPIAVMINNHDQARINHAGLQDAYIVYEMIAEGGLTRMMAIFKDQNTAKIGSVRSARHYFLDYALENDAIYTHYGWSPQAESDIKKLSVDNINGLYDEPFWRDTTLNVSYEHTAFTSMEKLTSFIKKKNYRMTSSQDLLLNYSVDSIALNEMDNAAVANKISIPYSIYVKTSYNYDSTNAVYNRSVNGVAHVDAITKKQYTAKNVIIAKIKNSSIDSYGRQTLDNIGSGDGYFITNGYAVPITWKKSSRTSQTVYSYLDGTEITANDGNTFIQNVPLTSIVGIE